MPDLVLAISFDHWQLPADLDYLEPRVAREYQNGEGQRDDIDFMAALADELDAQQVLDFGCGTGELAVALVKEGRRVIGLDPAKAMLDLARTRGGAHLVAGFVVEQTYGDWKRSPLTPPRPDIAAVAKRV